MRPPFVVFTPFAGGALAALVTVAVLLFACGGLRYDVPPDATWKERDEYCFFFQVDPRGEHNSNIGWTDTRPVITESAAGRTLTAVNARVSLNHNITSYHGKAKDDWFRADVLWASDPGGLVSVERMCAN